MNTINEYNDVAINDVAINDVAINVSINDVAMMLQWCCDDVAINAAINECNGCNKWIQ